MILLPPVYFDDSEIRLPATVAGVVGLCQFCADQSGTEDFLKLLAQQPGLFLYLAGRHYQCKGSAITSWPQWLDEFTLPAEIPVDSFATIGHLDEKQFGSLCRWNKISNRKSLRKILIAFANVSADVAKRCINQWVSTAAIDGASADNQPTTAIWPEGSTANESLTLFQMWSSTAAFQQIKICFSDDLFAAKMRSLKQLAYGASHEINNPLANIASRAQALMADEARQSRKQQLSVIYAQAIRAHDMISDMMLFAHPPEPEVGQGQLIDIAKDIQHELFAILKERNIELRIRQYPDAVSLLLDRGQITIAVKSLVENAMNALGSDGKICIQIWREDEHHMAAAVVDDGPGIDDELASKIFDPFFSGREAGRGIGFGLSKAWRITEMHGGSLEFDASYVSGARFVLKLPIELHQPKETHQAKKNIARIDSARAA